VVAVALLAAQLDAALVAEHAAAELAAPGEGAPF
jgi:hypothetical protein